MRGDGTVVEEVVVMGGTTTVVVVVGVDVVAVVGVVTQKLSSEGWCIIFI